MRRAMDFPSPSFGRGLGEGLAPSKSLKSEKSSDERTDLELSFKYYVFVVSAHPDREPQD